ncbi:4-hydroxy-tetrahydrodipicolinate reductase [Virgibacillus dakarensis]|uniref:4-hydroxy-tetrahydrodipicolinate reductase n=1 Tax=Lentibacillus populi TaxID=1827502 RepID=A0A9W5TUZ4_9BACI|nr:MULTISPECIES: 4-hydroxy-tetrahydrodipicolinate reductase [Bacillaceae]MBT2214248.1 4-hydroxy-tetrahydrodipicolinate reductase [Virgibacillus dakarensis]MTW85927.1 4-hydroxy-tetrahydrodipicolinate reductase [Virgibacillus dakarensis]GGB33352.1 4-hydroxy-tetrahydrodipicolinate reductase [Lentibacillus populi]
MTIKIIIAGPRGKMGSEAIHMVENEASFNLVACVDRINGGSQMKDVEGLPNLDVPIFEDAVACFGQVQADVFIDLTVPGAAFEHTKQALNHNIRPVVGTSGLSNEQIEVLTQIAQEVKTGCLIAPNFAVGAVLMMQFAKMAAKHFPDVEIIEKHHDQKLDAPSGSAIKTAQLIAETRRAKQQGHPEETETISGARGAEMDGMRIHSVRLPGLVAHQEVMFGGSGQTLTIKHDSYNRGSFMAGIKFAVNQVMNLDELVYGLENILE